VTEPLDTSAPATDPIEDPRLSPKPVALPSGRIRAKSISVKRLSKAALAAGRAAYPDEGQGEERPRTRAECPDTSEAPCPWVGCKHHLYLDVNQSTGSIKINFPDHEVWEITHSCALDVADPSRTGEGDGATLEEVGELLNITRERVRQIQDRSLVQLRRSATEAVRDHLPDSTTKETPPAPAHDAAREDRNLRALALAGWTRVRVDIAGADERWCDPEGRIVSRATAIRAARALLTVVL
jgi:hypothetical protein